MSIVSTGRYEKTRVEKVYFLFSTPPTGLDLYNIVRDNDLNDYEVQIFEPNPDALLSGVFHGYRVEFTKEIK